MKAVIYARYSSNRQREASIEDQLRICHEWCDREGYEVVATYCDRAVSGRTDDRPEFQRMISNAGESDIVLVYMMDRFSRDPYDAPIYKKKLRDKGVKVVSATEVIPDTIEAVIIEKLYEGLAVIESAHIAERTKRGMEGNALKCMHNGVPVFGYDFGEDGHYVVNEDEAVIVREVFARRISGESSNSIASDLRKRGIETTTGHPASYTFVNSMLKNEKYRGVYSWGDVRVEGGMPRIIEDAVFYRAGAVRPRKLRQNETWDKFPLSGRAFCECCGRNMVGVSGRNRTGAKYTYYRCGQKCGARPIRADALEGMLAAKLREIISDHDTAYRIAKAIEAYANSDKSRQSFESAKNRRDAAEKRVGRLLKAVSEGLDYDLVKEEIMRQNALKAAAETEMATYESEPRFSAEQFCAFIQRCAELPDWDLVDGMVSQVLVGDEEIVATLRFKNEKCEPAQVTVVRTIEDWLPG